MTGFVYAIVAGADRVKIGWSADPLRRLTKLKSDCPGEAHLVGVIEATRAQEAEVQELLVLWRIRREWFDLTAAPVASFVAMLPSPTPKPVKQFGNGRAHPISQYRARNHITLEWLSVQVGVTKSCLCRYEQGRQLPRKHIMRRLTEVTGITADEMLGACA